jgi:4-hydroxybenzoate polyprenyltransferase
MPDRAIGRAIGPVAASAALPACGQLPHHPDVLHGRAGYAERSTTIDIDRLRRIVTGLTAPLYQRIRRGEGGLLVLNASWALTYYPLRQGFGLAAISLLCLLALYLFNDIVDARDDQHNPKKDRLLAQSYVRERPTFLALWLLMSGCAVVAGAWLDTRVAVWVAAVSLINVLYSLLCKKVPLLDIVWVGLWGGAYASIVTGATAWIVLVSAMTSVCHIYQISEDRGADAASGFATSATLRAPLLTALQAGLDVVIVAAAWTVSGSVAALTLAALFAYWVAWHDRPRSAWILAKLHFSVVWAYLLVRG